MGCWWGFTGNLRYPEATGYFRWGSEVEKAEKVGELMVGVELSNQLWVHQSSATMKITYFLTYLTYFELFWLISNLYESLNGEAHIFGRGKQLKK